MRKVATYGAGKHVMQFCFFDRVPKSGFELPLKMELVNVNIKCADRAGVAKILRRYHAAEIAVRHDEYQHCPKYGLRYIALRYPALIIYTTDKRGEPLMKLRYFCYHFKGYLPERKKKLAERNFGYQEC